MEGSVSVLWWEEVQLCGWKDGKDEDGKAKGKGRTPPRPQHTPRQTPEPPNPSEAACKFRLDKQKYRARDMT